MVITMGVKIKKYKPVLKSGKQYKTSAFGWRTIGGLRRFHYGIDLVRYDSKGKLHSDDVVAFACGTVTAVKNNVAGQDFKYNLKGNYVEINHGAGWRSKYFHLKQGSVTVKKGDKVKNGDKIGFMGNTGYSLGTHLHFQLEYYDKKKKRWIAVNPYHYLVGNKKIDN